MKRHAVIRAFASDFMTACRLMTAVRGGYGEAAQRAPPTAEGSAIFSCLILEKKKGVRASAIPPSLEPT